MKKIIITLFILAGFTSVSSADVVDFTGDYAVGNWTETIDGGSIDTSGGPSSIVLVSGEKEADTEQDDNSSNQDFTIAAILNSIVSFNWAFDTDDEDGPSYDPFGYLLNGIFTQLTDDVGSGTQNGSMSFAVSAGDIFGFRAHSTDSCCGASTTTVSGFSVVNDVPEPAPLALLGFGLIGFAALRRRKLAA